MNLEQINGIFFMIISYKTRELRDEILNDFLIQNKFPQEVVKRLKFYLSILSAADSVSKTPLQGNRTTKPLKSKNRLNCEQKGEPSCSPIRLTI